MNCKWVLEEWAFSDGLICSAFLALDGCKLIRWVWCPFHVALWLYNRKQLTKIVKHKSRQCFASCFSSFARWPWLVAFNIYHFPRLPFFSLWGKAKVTRVGESLYYEKVEDTSGKDVLVAWRIRKSTSASEDFRHFCLGVLRRCPKHALVLENQKNAVVPHIGVCWAKSQWILEVVLGFHLLSFAFWRSKPLFQAACLQQREAWQIAWEIHLQPNSCYDNYTHVQPESHIHFYV